MLLYALGKAAMESAGRVKRTMRRMMKTSLKMKSTTMKVTIFSTTMISKSMIVRMVETVKGSEMRMKRTTRKSMRMSTPKIKMKKLRLRLLKVAISSKPLNTIMALIMKMKKMEI